MTTSGFYPHRLGRRDVFSANLELSSNATSVEALNIYIHTSRAEHIAVITFLRHVVGIILSRLTEMNM